MALLNRQRSTAEEVLAGVWRLRLPLIWEEIRSVNAWALDDGDGGCVLVDCGMDGPEMWDWLKGGLDAAGFSPEQVSLLVCTHCHGDHYGLAGTVQDHSGCEFWMHPNHGHLTRERQDLESLRQSRVARCRRSGVPPESMWACADLREEDVGVTRTVLPDHPLGDGTVVPTGLGDWQVLETPGHAPSHICLYQPKLGVLVSGDHLLGVWAPYFDHGYTEDPVGQYLASLRIVEELDVRLVLPGHGRSFEGGADRAQICRQAVAEDLQTICERLAERPRTVWTLISDLFELPTDLARAWQVPTIRSYLEHLERRDEVRSEEDRDEVELWQTTS